MDYQDYSKYYDIFENKIVKQSFHQYLFFLCFDLYALYLKVQRFIEKNLFTELFH